MFLVWLASTPSAHNLPVVNANSRENSPDQVLINGKIITVDSQDSIAEAVAITQGKIVAVGSNKDIVQKVGDNTRVVDLHLRTATPGLIDSYGHFADGGVNELYHVDLSDAAGIDDVRRKVREKVGALLPGDWVQGDGWDEGKLAERRYVFASDLDDVSPRNPVWLLHTTGHYGAANSYAMRLAHFTLNPNRIGLGRKERFWNGFGELSESRSHPLLQAKLLGMPAQNLCCKDGIVLVYSDFVRVEVPSLASA
jgi:predicted amidohydrolase YtcJ